MDAAKKLGYAERAGYLPVESLMQSVYQTFHGVGVVSTEFWERLLESRGGVSAAEGMQGEPLEDGLFELNGKIHIHTERYPATPGHLVHLFRLAAEDGDDVFDGDDEKLVVGFEIDGVARLRQALGELLFQSLALGNISHYPDGMPLPLNFVG